MWEWEAKGGGERMTCCANIMGNLTHFKVFIYIYILKNKTSAAAKLRNKLLRLRVIIEINGRIVI